MLNSLRYTSYTKILQVYFFFLINTVSCRCSAKRMISFFYLFIFEQLITRLPENGISFKTPSVDCQCLPGMAQDMI